MAATMSIRSKELARIHCLKRDLRLSDEEYRDVLFVVCRTRSAGDLDFSGRLRLIDHLAAMLQRQGGRRDTEWGWVDQASADRRPLLRKLIMQLRSAGRPRAYVDNMARHMFHVDRLEFCSPDQLHAIVAALSKDAERRQR
jgi:phage gp16-like protein